MQSTKSLFKIMFDIDDVLIQFYRSFFDWYNQRNGTNFTVEDQKQYFLGPTLGISEKEAHDLVMVFYYSPVHRFIPITPFSRDLLKKISENDLFDKPVLITSRHEEIHLQTWEVINLNFHKFAFGGMHMLGCYHLDDVDKKRRCKSELCLELGVHLAFEDSPHYAEKISEKGIPVLLLDKPWNRSFDESKNPFIVRINCLSDACSKIDFFLNWHLDDRSCVV
jgi:uncharacterized HAD superfamily protein